MKRLYSACLQVLSVLFFALLFFCPFPGQGQEIVINEYFNASSQNEEWTELVVVKDNLDLSGWFLGDNNAGTSSWQPKIQFKSLPLWKNLRAGTLIHIDHASNGNNCNDPVVTDKSRGYIRVCSKDSAFFDGGSSSTLFLADGGDFVHIVDPSGKMVHGIGHDDNPGSSVEGGTCFPSSLDWKNISAAVPGTRPCGNFTYYRFGMEAPTSLRMKAGVLADFSAGMQTSASNPFLDTSDVPSTGTGNGELNDNWLIELRQPELEAQVVCPTRLPDGTISFTWQAAEDLFPQDNLTGYLILRSTTEEFTLPEQGRGYPEGQVLGSGPAQTRIVKVISGSATTTFSENPGTGTFFYRVIAFRFNPEPSFVHPTRGRTYNRNNLVVVNSFQTPEIPVRNDTLCAPGLAVLRAVAPQGTTLAWYPTATGGNPLPANGDSLEIFVQASRSFWVEVINSQICALGRIEVKAVLQPLTVRYSASPSVCVGAPAFIRGDSIPGVSYQVNFGPLPPGTVVKQASPNVWSVSVVEDTIRRVIRYSIRSRKGDCSSNVVADSLVVNSIKTLVLASVSQLIPDQEFFVRVLIPQFGLNHRLLSFRNAMVSDSVFPFQFSAKALEGDSASFTIRVNHGSGCNVLRKLAIPIVAPPRDLKPINTLITADGDLRNAVLDFDRREVRHLNIYNRWGLKVADFDVYTNSWRPSDSELGTFFYQAEIREPGQTDFQKVKGWVEVVR